MKNHHALPLAVLNEIFPYHWIADHTGLLIAEGAALSSLAGDGGGAVNQRFELIDSTHPIDLEGEQDSLQLRVAGTQVIIEGSYHQVPGHAVFLGRRLTPQRSDAEHMTHQLKELVEELARREARLQALIQGTSDVVAILDQSGRFRWANANIELVLMRAPHVALGETFHEWMPPEHGARFQTLLNELAPIDGARAETETPCCTPDGTPVPLLVAVRNALNDPNVNGFIVSARDITAQRRLWSQLLQAQKMESSGQFAGGIAHDFNNLLMVVLLYTDLVAEQVADTGTLQADLLEIKQAAERATALTRQILMFSRKQTVDPVVVYLDETLSNLEKMLHRVVGDHYVIDSQFERHLRPVRADPGQIEQVVVNLILNGRDAMPSGGALTLTLRNEKLSRATRDAMGNTMLKGRYVSCTVGDQGAGMSDEEIARIFEPFYTTKVDGTGLGLATVFGVVAAHSGGLFVYSSLGEGTRIAMWLPVEEHEVVSHLEGPDEPADLPRGTGTVVLVEDAHEVRQLTKRMLTELGYTVLDTHDPTAALELVVRSAGPVVLLTDMLMPKLNGVDLAALARTRRPNLPVLYMSGYTDDMLAEVEPLQLLRKPFTRAELAWRVRNLFRDV